VDNPKVAERMTDVAKEAASKEASSEEIQPWQRVVADPVKGKSLVTDNAAPLIDVRIVDQYNTQHLPGAHNIPLGSMPTRVSEVAALNGGDKTKPVVLYCNSGRQAAKAKILLESQGFTNVTSAGGIGDWPGGAANPAEKAP
jgi:rhodanese-related sulfurtransferase